MLAHLFTLNKIPHTGNTQTSRTCVLYSQNGQKRSTNCQKRTKKEEEKTDKKHSKWSTIIHNSQYGPIWPETVKKYQKRLKMVKTGQKWSTTVNNG